jgi:hypothetical protein
MSVVGCEVEVKRAWVVGTGETKTSETCEREGRELGAQTH